MEENILDSGSTNDIFSPESTNELPHDAGIDDVGQYINGKKRYQCKICNNFFTMSHLQYHVKILHSEENTYTCKVCGEVFKQKYYFNVHMKSHDDLKPWKCETCGKRYTTKYGLKIHQDRHSNMQFPCKTCNKTFRHILSLKLHEKLHTNDKRYKCEICGRKFLMQCQLNYHIKLHSFKVQCSICNRFFFTRRQMNKHKVIHTGNFEHSFSCPVCFKFFFRQSHLEKHIKNHNRHVSGNSNSISSKSKRIKTKSSHECDICKQSYVSKSALAVHRRCHTGEKPFTCYICKKSFRYLPTLKMHSIVKHGADAKFRCEICNKGFYSKLLYHDHMNGHTGHKPYQCQVCQKHFVRKSSFYSHMRTKHSDKIESAKEDNSKYKCDFCGKMLKSPSERIIHMRKHTGYFPFRCDQCGKAFSSKNACNTHMNTHTLPFQCGICHEKYSKRTDLLKHVETHKIVDRNTSKSEMEHVETLKTVDMNTCTKSKPKLDISKVKSGIYSNRLSYECGICRVHYRTRKDMLNHIGRHKSFEKNTTESISEIDELLERHALPYECGICHVQYTKMVFLLRHIKNHRTEEENASENNISELVQGQPKPVNTQSESSFSSVGLKTEPVETSSTIVNHLETENESTSHANFEVLGGRDGLGGDSMCNLETSVMKVEGNPAQERNMNLTPVSLSGEQEIGCFTQSIPQIISLNHNETSNTAGNTGLVKSELHINQTVNNEQGRNDNVLVMKKIGSFKVSKEELEQILSRGTFVIKPDVSQNNANKS